MKKRRKIRIGGSEDTHGKVLSLASREETADGERSEVIAITGERD